LVWLERVIEMGYAISWYAVREESAPQFLEQLGLVPGTETEDFPESLVSTAKLQTGWRILWYGKYDCPFLGSDKLASISENFDVLACLVEEHVMASSAEYWSRGERSWWISHQGEDGPKGLDFGGALPECFATIKSDMEDVQRAEGGDEADVDFIFEIPLRVAQSVVGFKHDEECLSLTEEKFVVLDETSRPESAKAKTSLISRFFGK
jgi:hypothetical protein